MSDITNSQKTLEVKIRPFPNPNNQERSDQKGAARVLLSRDALLHLGLESGQICYLWRNGESRDARIQAVAWLSPEKSLGKKVIQMSKTFQDIFSFKLSDDLNICAGGSLPVLETVFMSDITILDDKHHKLGQSNRHWEWFLANDALSMSCQCPSSYDTLS